MPKKKGSSPKKPSTKAVTQTRSTTSSTTASNARKKAARKKVAKKKTQKTTRDSKSKTHKHSASEPVGLTPATFLLKSDKPSLLSEELQYTYITLLSRGASPAAACTQLGILLADVIWTMEHDSGFQSMLESVQELLSQNVAAALYRSAMEGSVSAQQNYLKAYPPPGSGATTGESDDTSHSEMTHEELNDFLRKEAEAFLAEIT